MYVGCASSDLGDDIADWAGSLATVAEGISATTTYTPQLSLSGGLNYIRAFVSYGAATVASSPVSIRVLAYGDYGGLTDVYEYIGEDNSLVAAANWAKDKVAPAAEAPTAGTDIRWFGRNAALTVSGFSLYSTDHFVGVTINTTSGNHDCPLNGDILLVDSSVTLSTIIIGETPHSITLTNSHFTTTRCPDGDAGFYPNIPNGAVNFLSGAPSSFSFGKDNNYVHDGDSARSLLAGGGKILLDGAAVGEDAFRTFFTTNAVDAGKSITVDEESVPMKSLTITYWEPVWTGVPKADWTVQPGARVKLTKDTRIGSLTVTDAADVKIDLNGYNLKVVALFVDGEKKRGEFAAGDLPMLIGEGSLTVASSSFRTRSATTLRATRRGCLTAGRRRGMPPIRSRTE